MRRRDTETHPEGRGHMLTVTEIGMMPLQTKEGQGLWLAPEARKK